MSYLTVDEEVADLIGKDLTLARDYASIINWSVAQIEKWTDQWTDYTITDPGILFLNADAHLYDMINYVLDDSYMNNVLRWTKSMESLLYMAAFVGLDVEGYVSAVAQLEIKNNTSIDVILPKGYRMVVEDPATQERVYFNLLQDVLVPAGTKIGVAKDGTYIKALEGEMRTKRIIFGGFDPEDELQRELQFDSRFSNEIKNPRVSANTVTMEAKYCRNEHDNNGQPYWQEIPRVKDAFLSVADSIVFSVSLTHQGVHLHLCPGVKDFLEETSEIVIHYGISSGVKANIGQTTAKGVDPVMSGALEVQDQLEFHILKAAGGKDPMGLEELRIYIGDNTWRCDTLLTDSDFNRLAAKKFPDEIVRFCFEQEKQVNAAQLKFLPTNEDLTQEQILELGGRVMNEVTPYLFGGTTPMVEVMYPFRLDLQFLITLKTNSSNTGAIAEKIQQLMADYFNIKTQPAGMALQRARLCSIIETNLQEVDYAICLAPASDIQIEPRTYFSLQSCHCSFDKRKGGSIVNVYTI